MGHLLLRVLWHGDKHWCSDLDLDKFSTTVQHQTHFNILIYSFGENASTARTLYTVLSRGLQTDGSAPRSDMCLFFTSHHHTHIHHQHAILQDICLFPPLGVNACTVARLEAVANCAYTYTC